METVMGERVMCKNKIFPSYENIDRYRSRSPRYVIKPKLIPEMHAYFHLMDEIFHTRHTSRLVPTAARLIFSIAREEKWTDAVLQALGDNKAKNYWKVCRILLKSTSLLIMRILISRIILDYVKKTGRNSSYNIGKKRACTIY
jgi:hypothetical protein